MAGKVKHAGLYKYGDTKFGEKAKLLLLDWCENDSKDENVRESRHTRSANQTIKRNLNATAANAIVFNICTGTMPIITRDNHSYIIFMQRIILKVASMTDLKFGSDRVKTFILL